VHVSLIELVISHWLHRTTQVIYIIQRGTKTVTWPEIQFPTFSLRVRWNIITGNNRFTRRIFDLHCVSDVGICHCHNPSGHAMGVGLTQPLTEITTRTISWGGGGKGGRYIGLATLLLSCADFLEIWERQTPGTLRACPGLYSDLLPC
jgi:hypothetical protein